MIVTCPYCHPDSAGQHELGCPNNPLFVRQDPPEAIARVGWICPRCGRVNAPTTSWCPCPPEMGTTTNTGGTTQTRIVGTGPMTGDMPSAKEGT